MSNPLLVYSLRMVYREGSEVLVLYSEPDVSLIYLKK